MAVYKLGKPESLLDSEVGNDMLGRLSSIEGCSDRLKDFDTSAPSASGIT